MYTSLKSISDCFLYFAGVAAGILALLFPETNKCKMMETLEEAEMFYRTKKQRAETHRYWPDQIYICLLYTSDAADE